MNTNLGRRDQWVGTGPQQHHAPNAALLIDFDNVTMAVRSDLGKELKSLLNSDIIKGKVAVQRAYADWRRYPQYIVPLAESSIDLIFAPAYGSSKKNATDLRMAIDAIELVFTRPEIGTFILLTGDSDFSSCVLKLKEYGKYVIGVGMKESSSDLLIQNCDEYYSYSALSGLTRTTHGAVAMESDPWALVQRAAQQMIASRDILRTDRLKQVMLEMDPNFDEKKLGYPKFSRFVSEAASKGLVKTRKAENGQYEIVPLDGGEAEAPAPAPRPEPRADEGERERGRTRGGRGRGRGRDRERETEAPAAAQPAGEVSEAAPESTAPEAETASERAPAAAPAPSGALDLETSYAVLQHAVQQLTGGNGSIRDGDVKRKMLELAPGFDEGELGFSRFTRYLRQAHDGEVIDLQRTGSGNYEVSLHGSRPDRPLPELAAAPARPEGGPPREERQERPEREASQERTESAPAAREATREATPAAAPAPPRRRGRSGKALEGPPPLLPGQVVELAGSAAPEAAPAEGEAPADEGSEKSASRSRRGRRGGRGRGARAESAPSASEEILELAIPQPEVEATPAAEEKPAARPKRKRKKTGFDAGALGLPQEAEAVRTYIAETYRGIGAKTADSLIDEFGEDGVFDALEEDSERVKEMLGAGRAATLLDQWEEDRKRRLRHAPPAEEKKPVRKAAVKKPAAKKPVAKKVAAKKDTAKAPAKKAAAKKPAAKKATAATTRAKKSKDTGAGG
jgi:uncharacterized protein (TIGR00288 family)